MYKRQVCACPEGGGQMCVWFDTCLCSSPKGDGWMCGMAVGLSCFYIYILREDAHTETLNIFRITSVRQRGRCRKERVVQ